MHQPPLLSCVLFHALARAANRWAVSSLVVVGVMLMNATVCGAAGVNEPASTPVFLSGKGQRFSDALAEQGYERTAEDPVIPLWAVSWITANEVGVQSERQSRILYDLKALTQQHAPLSAWLPKPLGGARPNPASESLLRFAQALSELPATGRASLVSTDRYWLMAHPEHDPRLAVGDQVVINLHPPGVHVVSSDGRYCVVPFDSHADASAYWHWCERAHGAPAPSRTWEALSSSVVALWVANPNQAIDVQGIARFNASRLVYPTPGAWIFAPVMQHKLTDAQSRDILWWLSTQWDEPRVAEVFGALNATQQSGEGLDSSTTTLAATAGTGTGLQADLRATSSSAQDPMVPPATRNDLGLVGLLETPTARQTEAGDVAFVGNVVYPYERTNFMFQRSDWMEGGFRYTRICNRTFGGPADRPINFCYEDKSTTLKLKIHQESEWTPQIALGMNDLLGTGLFSGEYVVASKRVNAFDFSLGMGFGYFGERANLNHPLSFLGSHFKERQEPAHGFLGSIINYNAWFTGPGALFGGVNYQTPIPGLSLKLEAEGNNYQHESLGNAFVVNSPLGKNTPVNIGLTYQLPHVEITAALERGNALAVNFNYHGNLSKLGTSTRHWEPMADQLESTPVVEAFKTSDALASIKAALSQQIATATGWQPLKLVETGDEWRLTVTDGAGSFIQERLIRVAEVLDRYAPPTVRLFTVEVHNEGMTVADYPIDRERWQQRHSVLLPPHEVEPPVLLQTAPVLAPVDDALNPSNTLLDYGRRQPFDWNLGVGYQEIIAGPNGFGPVYDTNLDLNARADLWSGAFASTTLSLRGPNNFGHYVFTYNGAGNPGNYQYVRRHLSDYLLDGSGVTLRELQLTQVKQLSDSQFLSVYAGYLEWMFAGVGAEYLYRPVGAHWGLGANLNRVEQRDFKQDFGFLKPTYDVTTGHGVGVWETDDGGWRAKLSLGKYLAGDRGGTLDLSRRFQNGMRIGAYVTKTNMPSIDFTEGGSDRGIYFSIPFDALLNGPSKSVASFNWEVYYKDGGAMLARRYNLWDMTDARDGAALLVGPRAQ